MKPFQKTVWSTQSLQSNGVAGEEPGNTVLRAGARKELRPAGQRPPRPAAPAMFFPPIAADPKRRSKLVADRLFCLLCLLLCFTGPALLALGTLLFSTFDARSGNVAAYNDAVRDWNGDGGGLARFEATSFTVTARPRGFSQNLTRNVMEPFSEVRAPPPSCARA